MTALRRLRAARATALDAARLAAATPVVRTASVTLRPNGGHSLNVELALASISLDRGQVAVLSEALSRVAEADVLALVGTFWPALKAGGDLKFLREAIGRFEAECRYEDRHERINEHRRKLI